MTLTHGAMKTPEACANATCLTSKQPADPPPGLFAMIAAKCSARSFGCALQQRGSTRLRDGKVFSVCVIVSIWVFSATLFCFSLSIPSRFARRVSYLVIGAPSPRTMGIGTSTVGGTPPRSEPDAADLNTRRHKTTEPVEAPEFQVPVAGAAVSVSGLVQNQG